MSSRLQLLGRFVLPLAALGLLLGGMVFWALSQQQSQMLERELRERAAFVAYEVERGLQHYGSAAETLSILLAGARGSIDVSHLHIVEISQGLVVASTDAASASRLPVFSGSTQWASGSQMSFAQPIAMQARHVPGARGRDFAAVVTLDASTLIGHHRAQLRVLMTISLLGAAVLLGGVFLLLRRLVIEPISRIQGAVQQARHSGRWRMPVMRDDEIGQLSAILESNVRSLSDQQQFVQSMFDSLSGVAYRADARTGQILLSSGGLDALLGQGATHADLFGGADSDSYRRFESIVSSGELWNIDYALRENDDTIWFAHRGRAIYGRDGRPMFYDGLLLDITERKSTEDRIALMSEALRNSSNEVYIIDVETLGIRYANKAAVSNLRYSEPELLGMTVPQVAPKMLSDDVAQALGDQLVSNNEIHYRYVHRRKDGTEYPFEFVATGVARNDRHWLIVLGSDVTERLAQEEAVLKSEERLSLALEGASYGIFDFAGRGEGVYLSDSIRGWLGLGDQDVVRLSSVIEAVHPDDLRALTDQLRSRESDTAQFNVEVRLRGVLRWLHLRGDASFDAEGELQRLNGFAADITRRKQAEDLVHSTAERLEAVLEHVADGIVTLTRGGRITTANPAFLEMFAADREAVIGSSFTQWFDDPLVLEELSDGRSKECKGVRQGGWVIPCEIAARSMEGAQEDRYTVLVRDTSQRKQAEAELRSAMKAAQAATRAKGEFLATMSHEIRTPMNGVLGMTQLLLDTELSDEQRETAQVIFSSGEALLAIINDILDFSKIEAGKLEFEEAPFDLAASIRDVMELLAGSARDKALDLYVDYPEGIPRGFMGDAGRVRQVLLNLVGNAIKFTGEGHVIVSAECIDDERVTIRVRDTGPGLATDVQQKLFDSFTQADASTTRRFGGTGLGLAICKQLVTLMGGEIGVSSAPGEGAEFWFSLALPQTDAALADQEPVAALDGVRMLIVDDNPVGREIFERMMGSLGARCEAVSSGKAALDHLRQHSVDVLLLDYHMPEMDGLQVVQAIQADPNLRNMKILMLTSSDVARIDGVLSAVKPVMREGVARLCRKLLDDEVNAVQSAPAADGEEAVLDGLRVLLAEDNVVNQKVAVRMLEKLGCTVDVAANGEEAVRMWRQFPYALIFMDCQMPEVDGLEATRRIRSLDGGAEVPIVAMTANAMERDREACMEAGMNDYASKPVKIGMLEQLLERYAAH